MFSMSSVLGRDSLGRFALRKATAVFLCYYVEARYSEWHITIFTMYACTI